MIEPVEGTNRPQHGGNLAWAASVAGCSPSSILDFSASINPWGPPDSALNAIQTHLNQLRAYPNPDYQELREAIAQVHECVGADWILPGNGAAELLTWAGRELSQLDVTVLPTPAFGDYKRTLATFDANIVECPFSLSASELDCSCLDSSTRFQSRGLLLNNPHNPTGKLFSTEMILPYLEQFSLVVVDEAFMDFLPPSQQQSLISQVEKFENLVILRSLTKFYSLPGLRLGYAIAHPKRLQRWQQWRDPWPVNSLAVAAGIAVLQDQKFQQYTWNWLEKARSQLFESLRSISGLNPYPSAANFLFIESEVSVIELQSSLLKNYQILIRDCLSFPELGDRFFRVAVRTEAENQQLIFALQQIL